MGDSATRGGRTFTLSSGVSPTSSNSLTPWGNVAEVKLAFSTFASFTMFTTNCRVSRTFRRVSFTSRSAGFDGQNNTAGGLLQIPLKKLKGARFVTPAALIVLTQAIGRGATDPSSSL